MSSFYIEGFLFVEGTTPSSHGLAMLEAGTLAAHMPDRSLILVFRMAGETDLVFTHVRDLGDTVSCDPIDNDKAEQMFRDCLVMVGTAVLGMKR